MPCVWCIVGFEWRGGCRSIETLVNEETARALKARGWVVMRDPWAPEIAIEQVRQAEEQKWNPPRLWRSRPRRTDFYGTTGE